jgi:hypothetical protein
MAPPFVRRTGSGLTVPPSLRGVETSGNHLARDAERAVGWDCHGRCRGVRIRQYFLGLDPAASMVACINAIVGGLVPELYEGLSPGLPGWTERTERREA